MNSHTDSIPVSNKRYKKVFYSLSALAVSLLVAVIVLASVLGTGSSSKSDDSKSKEICATKACIKAANGILQNMNASVNPCDDFFQFACGSFVQNQRIPEDQSSQTLFGILRTTLSNVVSDLLEEPITSSDITSTENAKRLYRSCLNEAQIEQAGEQNFLKFINEEFGEWPALNAFANPQNIHLAFDPMKALVKFRLYGFRQLVDVRIEVNPKNSSLYVLKARQPTWFLNKDYYNASIPSSLKVIYAYKTYTKTFMTYLNKNIPVDDSVVDSMYDIEAALGVLINSETDRRNSTYINMTIEQLQKEVPNFDWETYILNGIYKEIPSVQLNNKETILVEDLNYLKKATELYQVIIKKNKNDFKNFLIWVFAKDRSGLLPKRFKDARLEFDKVYAGTNTLQARSLTCSNLVLNQMEYAAGRLYVSKYFNENSKKDATEMITYIRNSFKVILDQNEWMDSKSKLKAKQKADAIDPKIGYPEFTNNDTYLNEYYQDYVFTEDNYLQNTVLMYKVDAIDDFKALRDMRDKTDWISGPAVVNAFYSSSSNQICFPAGILQAPFYDSQQPKYLNFGGIGSVIGHEITHGFDDRGRRYDKDGTFFADNEEGLWTQSTIENYKEKAACIVGQYDNFYAKQVDLNLIGAQTQGENIADNGGIKESYYGYQNWVQDHAPEALLPGLDYNQNQLFFINYAQVWCSKYRDQALRNQIKTGVHSPGEFRVRGPTQNFIEFAKAFNCKKGSTHNPDRKCTVW